MQAMTLTRKPGRPVHLLIASSQVVARTTCGADPYRKNINVTTDKTHATCSRCLKEVR